MIRVEMLSTGDEVLHGQIIDTNAAWLADYFLIKVCLSAAGKPSVTHSRH